LQFVKKILKELPNHLNDHGIAIMEIGEKRRSLEALYPNVDFHWLPTSVGTQDVFAVTAKELKGNT
jgi:ribosomal protein L3 glutamine methyltransferase